MGLIQMSCGPDPAANLKKAIARIGEAAKKGAQIVCLQELFRSQYFCQSENIELFKLAETIPGPTTEALGKVARKHQLVILASLFEKRAAGVYHNTAVIIDEQGKITGKYRKMHIPDDPLYYEKFYFTPGDLGFQTHDTTFAKVGALVCWDQWFPEAARLTALSGSEFIFYPTAIGWLPDEDEEMNLAQHSAWETIQRAHAIANGVYVIVVNRVGAKENSHSGGSRLSPTLLAESSPKLHRIRKKCSWLTATSTRSKKQDKTGLFSATVGSISTHHSRPA